MSAFLEYLDFNGNSVRQYFKALGVIVEQPALPASGAPDISIAQIHASELVVESEYYLPGEMVIPFVIPVTHYDDAVLRRSRLIKLLDRPGAHKLFLPAVASNKYYRVKKTAVSALEPFGQGYRLSVTFACGPFLIGDTPVTSSDVLSSDPQTLSVAVQGIRNAHPKFTIENTSGADITALITIENLTTNERIDWQGTFTDGYFLLVDCTNVESVYKSATEATLGDDGTLANSGIAAGSVFPSLEGEETNSVKFTGLNGCTVNIWYEPEY